MSVEVEAPLAPLSAQVAEKVTAATAPIRVGGASWQLHLRSATIAVASLGVVFLLFCLDLGLGDVDISLGRTIRTLFGYSDPAAELIIGDLRLPQTTVALLVGMRSEERDEIGRA